MLTFGGQNNGEGNNALNQLITVLRGMSAWLGQAGDVAGRQRVTVEAFSATVPAVTTVSGVTNQTSMGGFAANDQVPALMLLGAQGLRNRIAVS